MVTGVQTYLISIVILMILYMSIRQQSRAVQQTNRYFLVLVILSILIMVFKILIEQYEGYTSGVPYLVLQFSTAFYYMLSVMIILYWLIYLQYLVKGESSSKRKVILLYTPFMVIAFGSILLSLIGVKAMYSINQYGGIERHVMYGIVTVSEYLIMLGSIVYVLWNRNELSKYDYWTLIMYQIPPIIGIILNEILVNVDLIWPSMTISLLMVYTNIQSRMTNTDPLTGVFNRREYEKQVSLLNEEKRRKNRVSALMIDIDDFKLINDQNSHQMGDIALIEVAQILQKSARKNDFISRIGGDEFCVIIESDQESVLHDVINRINYHLDLYNKDREKYKQIHLSIGYGIYDAPNHGSFKVFFDRLDRQMYEDKLSTKSESENEITGS